MVKRFDAMPSDIRLSNSGPTRPSKHSGTMHSFLVNKRRSGARLLLFFLIASLIFFFSPQFGDASWSLRQPIDHTETIQKIREAQVQLQEQWPRNPAATHRDFTIAALDRLAGCMETNSCGPGELTVIVLGSAHFGNSQRGHTSGEDIWAGSLINILQSHNYTLLYTYEPLESLLVYKALSDYIPLVIMEAQATDQCVMLGTINREIAAAAKPKVHGLEWLDPEAELGCAKRVGFEEGIPVQKIRSLHFWVGQRHPLPSFTLSPENYTGWYADTGNYYLGYHLEHCRHVSAARPHKRRAFILGKRPDYFSEEKYAWPRNVLEELTAEIGDGFEFVGGAGKKGVDEMPMKGITNLGSMDKETWNREVAESAVMLGVGNPPLSPSPYDAWCLGVPFINPILRRDAKNPDDVSKWNVQHNALKDFGPPYVYHVWKEDKEALKQAIQSAISTPFEPFIPDRMKRENVEQRLLHLVHHNWTAVAEEMIEDGTAKGFFSERLGQNTRNGLLL
ncbi:hypothetical protein DB88DRAFT_493059 [Papiliotrema laurentii]|uniref:Glycosyltransferase family 18 catalytic domain-containing protein n=1 Tax=Papiliotrema laurentii TaxID=5418 RepID=A0AAD9FPK8_PAPLA|nr:hypothetical protein DB88DRAFT_493059 [Papiliotrema laurentii]